MKPRAFCEFPSGLAAVSLALHGGKDCRPPISRMGNKAGYAHVILDCIGLRRGQGAGAYLWAESDPDVRGLLRAYPDADMLRRIAEIIRGWKDEEPRALWTRLRAERAERAASPELGDVAQWVWISGHGSPDGRLAAQYQSPNGNADGSWAAPPREWLADRCTRLAEYAQIAASNRLIHVAGPELRNTGAGGTTFGGAEFATPAAVVADGFDGVAEFAAREVAGHAILGQWSYRRGEPESGFNAGVEDGRAWNADASETARRFDAAPSRWPPVAILPTIPTPAKVSAWLGTPGDLDGVIVYADPPYVGTTGYRDVLPRAEVVAYARAFAEAGAHVVVSEAGAVAELTALGWDAVDIGGERRGQKRTFAANAGEWLTSSRPFVHRPAVALSLFGAPC